MFLVFLIGIILILNQFGVFNLALIGWEGTGSTEYVIQTSWCKYSDSWGEFQDDVQWLSGMSI